MKKFLLILSLAAICVCCTSPAGQRPKVLAHRGLCTTGTEFTTDENTLDALIRAQEKGCEGVEFDVYLTADSQLVIRHDNVIEKGKLSCTGSTFDEIQSLALIKELDMMDQVYILSFKSETLDEVLRQEPKMKVGLNSSSLHGSMPPQEVKAHGYAGISYNVSVIFNHPEWIKEFQDLGIDTFLWMVNSDFMKKLGEELGFTWMTTDFYDVIGY